MQALQRTIPAISRHAMVAVLVIVGALVVSLSAAQSAAKPTAKTKPAKVEIMLMKPTAPKTGDNQFEVMLKSADGKPISDADVSVLLVMPAMPAMKMPEMRNEVKLSSASPGTYTGTGQVMMAGKWNVTVSVKQGGKDIGQKKLTLTAK